MGCLFDNNSATRPAAPGNDLTRSGGGLGVWNETTGTDVSNLTIANTTFYNNQAANNGGGLAILTDSNSTNTSSTFLTSLTVYNNSCANGGGGLFASTLQTARLPRIWNSIFGKNQAGQQSWDVYGPIVSRGHNLVSTTNGSTGFDGTVDILGAIGNAVDPGLDPNGLTDNGGWTETVRLVAGSLAYRAGDTNLWGWTSLDQRGYHRIGTDAAGNDVVSIGAYDPDAA
jgi:hypothetical protein